MNSLRIFFPSAIGRALLVFALLLFGGWGMYELADDPSGMMAFLLYIIWLAFMVWSYRAPGIDPIAIFVGVTFLGFGLAYVVYFGNPDLLFFMNEVYRPAISVGRDEITQGFIYFLFGFAAYLIGAAIKIRPPRIKGALPIEGVYRWSALALMTVIISFWFRSTFKVGVPGVSDAAFPFVGYIYFPMQAFLMLSLGYAFLAALHSGSRRALAAALSVVMAHAGSMALLGWKSAIFMDLFLCGLIYVNCQTMVFTLTKEIKRFLSLSAIALWCLALLSFGLIGHYRNVAVIQGEEVSLGAFMSAVDVYSWSERSSDTTFSDSGIMGLLSRVSGINNLTPIVTYFEQGCGQGDRPSLLGNLLRVTEVTPEVYYTDNILGYTEPVASINAPTSWGALYIYGGLGGLVVGLFAFGVLFQWLYRITVKNAGSSPVVLVVYAFLMVDLYLNMIFEGVIVGFLYKNLIAAVMAYWAFNLALKMNRWIHYNHSTIKASQTGVVA